MLTVNFLIINKRRVISNWSKITEKVWTFWEMQNCRLLVLQSAGRKDFARLVVVAIDNENIIEYSSERTRIGLVEL